MPEQQPIHIRIDDRARLLSAALAATNHPDREQDRQKHGVTLHARGTRKWLAGQSAHPAVIALQSMLDQHVPLEAIYTHVLSSQWPTLTGAPATDGIPADFGAKLADFYTAANLAQWFKDEDDIWQTPVRHLHEIFGKVDLYKFLAVFFGNFSEKLALLPNMSYPTDQTLAIRVDPELIAIAPPRKAWGDSAPWPYDNDPVHTYQEALRAYIRLLMGAELRRQAELVAPLTSKTLPVGEKFSTLHPKWDDQVITLFTAGALAVFLEEAVNAREAKAYIHMMQKVEGLTLLPSVIDLLKRYQEERRGSKYENIVGYLPTFIRQLRVAKTLAKL